MIILYGEAKSPDIYYRVGWNSDAEVLYTEGKKRTVYVPGFEYARAKEEVQGVTVRKLTDLKKTVKALKGPHKIHSRMPYALAKELKGKKETTREVYPSRRIKTDEEIGNIMDAQEAAREAMAIILNRIDACTVQKGILVDRGEVVTSESLKALARTFLIDIGYDCPDIIISSGTQTAKPHDRGTGPINEGPVVIDIFPRSEHTLYHGDLSRTVILGGDLHYEMMLAAVKDAHDAAVKKCTPGTKASAVHKEAVRVLKERGFKTTAKEGLLHAVGHGVGLNIHEAPSLAPKDDTILEKGMVVTVEPGLYYDVGMRYENVIVVGDEPTIL